MLKQSDYVVTYITHTWGGACKFSEKARKGKKIVINIWNSYNVHSNKHDICKNSELYNV